MTRRVSAYERAMRQVIKTETCWLWPGQKTGNGYGLVSDWHPDGRRWKALVHRVVYEQVIGVRLDKASFRRKIEDQEIVEPVAGEKRGGAHRPAQLYRLRTGRKVEFARKI